MFGCARSDCGMTTAGCNKPGCAVLISMPGSPVTIKRAVPQAADVNILDPTGWRLRQSLGILSEIEFASAMGVTKSTLATWRQKRIGPRYGKVGKTVFYQISDIREWMGFCVAVR